MGLRIEVGGQLFELLPIATFFCHCERSEAILLRQYRFTALAMTGSAMQFQIAGCNEYSSRWHTMISLRS